MMDIIYTVCFCLFYFKCSVLFTLVRYVLTNISTQFLVQSLCVCVCVFIVLFGGGAGGGGYNTFM